MGQQISKKLNVKFHGKKLQKGKIDAYDLVDTILATAQVIEQIAKREKVLDDNKIRIDVSTPKPGSFDVDLIINLIDGTVGSSASAVAAKYLKRRHQ